MSESAERRFAHAAAIGLALASALLLVGLTRESAPSHPPPFLPTLLRALAVTGPLQVGLFWAPSVRGIRRIMAAVLMVPSALLFAGFAGEAIMKVVRGYPLRWDAAAVATAGVAIYAWQFWRIARAWLGREPHDGA